MTALRPGTSPPPVRMPIRFLAMTTPSRIRITHAPRCGSLRPPGEGRGPLRPVREQPGQAEKGRKRVGDDPGRNARQIGPHAAFVLEPLAERACGKRLAEL